MRGGHEHCIPRNSALLRNPRASVEYHLPRHCQRVQSHQGDTVLSIIEDARPHLARVVNLLRESLPVPPRHLHSDLRGNIPLGKSGLYRGIDAADWEEDESEGGEFLHVWEVRTSDRFRHPFTDGCLRPSTTIRGSSGVLEVPREK